ncbi:MAG: hypothetical protein ACR2F2_10525 [Pyrinomonadaceae bacterium]
MDSQETLRQDDEATDKILQAIGDLRREVNQQIGDLRREMNERLTKIENEIAEVKQSQFSFDVRLERVQAMAHDALNIGHDLKADVKILTAEVRAWSADVFELQQKV